MIDAPAGAPRLLLNGKPTRLEGVAPDSTLLDWLRGPAGLHGTKEGCAEGDCGACTVVLESLASDGSVLRRAANSCMLLVGQVDGMGVRTVEGLAAPDGSLHAVQAAFVATGGTQCGFCTPGFVMAAFAFAHGPQPVQTDHIHDALAGNLCRCTGYRPITDAVTQIGHLPPEPGDAVLAGALADLAQETHRFAASGAVFHAPRDLAEAAALRAAHPEAYLLAGGTDLGLLAGRHRERLPTVIHLGHVAELTDITEAAGTLRIGAAVSYTDAMAALVARHPGLHAYLTRLGSAQIRNLGTIGGNIGNASPIGDALPVLLALDASFELVSAARGSRFLPADRYFTGYRSSVLADDEIIARIVLPPAPPGATLVAEKISKRRDQDISSVCAAFHVVMASGRVSEIRLAYGGVAATPVRARAAEAALLGSALEDAAIEAAVAALAEEITPIGDWRASAAYRLLTAGNLLRRLQLRLLQPASLLEVDAL